MTFNFSCIDFLQWNGQRSEMTMKCHTDSNESRSHQRNRFLYMPIPQTKDRRQAEERTPQVRRCLIENNNAMMLPPHS